MTVSVAIATYNRSAMVREAIEAALAQTYAPAEIVVSDDASADGTWEMLSAMPVRAFRQPRNSGGVENWNFAIRQTSGDYIAWCSDDDRFLPDHLEAAVEYLEANPRAGFVFSSFVDCLESPEGRRMRPRELRFPDTRVVCRANLLPYLVRYYDWPFHPSTIVMRRGVWEATGPFDPAFALADTDWFVRAVERFPAAMLARHGVINRRHAGNWSNRLGSARMQREIREIVERGIRRIYADKPLRRVAWHLIWAANVKLRLMLTLMVRLRCGHADAACAAWRQIGGRRLAGAGERLIRRWCPEEENPAGSVTPL